MSSGQASLSALAITAAALLASPPVAAHDLWIVPSSFTPAVGEPVRLRLLLGDEAGDEAVPRAAAGTLVRFAAVGPDGERPVPGVGGFDPAGFVRPTVPGWYTIVYESMPSFAALDADAFRAYLREEGLAPDRAPFDGAREPVTELFRRSLKARFHVAAPGEPSTAVPPGGEVPAGLPLELVLETIEAPAPSVASSRPLHHLVLRLLREGVAVPGALVELRALEDRTGPRHRATTDAEGRLRVALEPGAWLATAVHLDASRPALADFESVWTSSTFELP